MEVCATTLLPKFGYPTRKHTKCAEASTGLSSYRPQGSGELEPLVTSASPVLSWKLDIRVTHAVVPSKGIGSTEGLLVGAQIAAHLLLPGIVDSVLVTCEVVWSGKHSVARLACARVDALTLVWPCLTVDIRCHAISDRFWPPKPRKPLYMSMTVPLMFL